MFRPSDPPSEGEGDPAGHYEVIYEAINEFHGSEDPLTSAQDLREDVDDSFDSDESDEAYSRLHPQVRGNKAYSRLHPQVRAN